MEYKDHTSGSDLTTDYLNQFQTDYVQAGFESWKVVGRTVGRIGESVPASTWSLPFGMWDYSEPIPGGFLTAQIAQRETFYLDTADAPTGSGGVTRTRQYKIRAIIMTNTVSPGATRVSSIFLANVSGIDASGYPTFGAAIANSTISPSGLAASKRYEYTSGIMTGISGHMALRLTTAAAVANSMVVVQASLLRRLA